MWKGMSALSASDKVTSARAWHFNPCGKGWMHCQPSQMEAPASTDHLKWSSRGLLGDNYTVKCKPLLWSRTGTWTRYWCTTDRMKSARAVGWQFNPWGKVRMHCLILFAAFDFCITQLYIDFPILQYSPLFCNNAMILSEVQFTCVCLFVMLNHHHDINQWENWKNAFSCQPPQIEPPTSSDHCNVLFHISICYIQMWLTGIGEC